MSHSQNVGGGKASRCRYVSREAHWAAYDALPPKVRQALWEGPLPISPNHVQESMRGGLTQRRALNRIKRTHANNCAAGLYHTAAKATMQRSNLP